MGLLSGIGKVFKLVTSPLGVLEDWANEPLKRWENNRQQQNADREVERRIREQTGVESVKSQLRREEAEHQASLEIKMQTEIARINTETEQWAKDEEFKRQEGYYEMSLNFSKKRGELMLNIADNLSKMEVESLNMAQNLVLEKTREYKALQDESAKEFQEEMRMILKEFSEDEEIKKIMLDTSKQKYQNILNATERFLISLEEEIKRINQNRTGLIDTVRKSTDNLLRATTNQMTLSSSNTNIKHIQGRISNDDIEDVQAEEVE